jgi:phage-related protein (TIGR01555 family)
MLNKYGTKQDNSTAYEYSHGGFEADFLLSGQYESNGLFAKIIDTPAEEAVKHGHDIGLKGSDAESYISDKLDSLDWEEKAATAIKWARLYGGALGVMFINDGGGLEEPLNVKRIKAIDEIRVYERAVINPDYSSLYVNDRRNQSRRTTKFGMPEYYQVSSIYGQFIVHESRCLIFRNGILPEYTAQPNYRFWGLPEYIRIKRELRETVTSHSTGVKMLDRAVQAIYSMKGLSELIATDDGTELVIKRLQAIDMARGIINSIAIDSEGETYDYKNMTFSGVKDIIDSTCNMLSAVTNIPQTILFGRSPAGENSTGKSDLENYYNYVEKIQKLMLKKNLKTLLDIIVRAGISAGELKEEPALKLTFNPLWSTSDSEQAEIDRQKADTQHIKAQTAQIYVDMAALDPSEVRKGLAQTEEFQVEELLEEIGADIENENLWGEEDLSGGMKETPSGNDTKKENVGNTDSGNKKDYGSVGVIVLNDTGEDILCGKRKDNGMVCGPGGHIEKGETPAQAAIRETQEEFGITPLNLKRLGQLHNVSDGKFGSPYIYLCTEYEGEPSASNEIRTPAFFPVDEFEPEDVQLFPPFAESLKTFYDVAKEKHLQNQLNNDTISEGYICTRADANKKCKAKNPSKCPYHGNGVLTGSREEKLEVLKARNKGREKEPFNYFELAPDKATFPAKWRPTGFTSPAYSKDHSERHNDSVECSSEAEYVQKAKIFLTSPRGEYGVAYVAENGTIFRYDYTTHEFAMANAKGTLITYFNPSHKKTAEYADNYYEGAVRNHEKEKV